MSAMRSKATQTSSMLSYHVKCRNQWRIRSLKIKCRLNWGSQLERVSQFKRFSKLQKSSQLERSSRLEIGSQL